MARKPQKQVDQQDERARTWTIIVYPESAPENWKGILDDLHIEWACSPLHDKDINGDGSQKKDHWHVILCFDGKKSYEQVKDIADSVNSPIPKRCHSAKGMIRYFTHIDNPDKVQYNRDQIEAHGGIDIDHFFEASELQMLYYIQEMIDFIEANDIVEFRDLMLYAKETHFDSWFRLLSFNCANIMDKYIKSKRNKEQNENAIEKSTGEIL